MKNELSAEIGQRLRVYRQLIKMTQEELAEKAGMHQTYIGQVERGEKNLTISSLQKITRSLNISISAVFDDVEELADAPENIALNATILFVTKILILSGISITYCQKLTN